MTILREKLTALGLKESPPFEVSPVVHQALLKQRAEAAVKEIEHLYQKGWSHGIGCIFAHQELGTFFNLDDWKDWTFKPSLHAFSKASDMKLITCTDVGRGWSFTELGLTVQNIAQEELSRA